MRAASVTIDGVEVARTDDEGYFPKCGASTEYGASKEGYANIFPTNNDILQAFPGNVKLYL